MNLEKNIVGTLSAARVSQRCLAIPLSIALFCSISYTLASCSQRNVQSGAETETEADSLSVYKNEYYSVEYPSRWEVYEEIEDGAEGGTDDEWVSTGQHEVDLLDSESMGLHIVKSCLQLQCSVDEYADFSVLVKGLADAGPSQEAADEDGEIDSYRYIGYERYDSVEVSGRRCVLLVYELVTAARDTLIQKQFIVQNDNFDTFYVNSTFRKNDVEAEDRGDLAVGSFKLK